MDKTTGRRPLIVVAAGMLVALIAAFLLASAGDSDERTEPSSVGDSALNERTPVTEGTTLSGAIEPRDPRSVYDPVEAGETTPSSFRQLLGRDQIAPIYDPTFVDADDVDWEPDALIVGVTGIDSAKAYPVSFLNRREMVIDHIDGDPILVSW